MRRGLTMLVAALACTVAAGSSAAAVAPLAVTVQSQTKTTVTLAWTPPAGAEGYAFKVNGKLVSSSQNGATATVRFSLANCTSPNACTVRAFTGLAEGSVAIGASPPPPPPPPPPGNASIYFGQAGGGAGTSCSSPLAVAQFNATTFPAGTIVGLCGTITSTVYVHGAGVNGNPVTIQFQTGASISQPYCDVQQGCMNITGQNYLIIDGNHTGAIQSSANGSALQFQKPALGLYMERDSHVVVTGLAFRNLYVHSSASDEALSSKSQYAIEDYNGSNNQVTGNTFVNTQVGVYYRTDPGYGVNNRVDHNDFGGVDNPLNQTYAFAGGSTGPFSYDHNNAHNFTAWDTTGDAYHHDGIHCYTAVNGGGQAVHSVGFYYYDNRFDTGVSAGGSNFTGMFFLEGGAGAGSTPCDDDSSNNYIFNNIVNAGTPQANGAIAAFAGLTHIWNNTLVGPDTGTVVQGLVSSNRATHTADWDERNNVVSTGNILVQSNTGLMAPNSPDFNVYANGGGNAFVCNNSFFNTGQFAGWKACIGQAGDAHSTYSASAKLGADGTPQAGSPTIGAGTNLTALCTGALVALCQDINGNARPVSGAWNAGAVG